jgi:hypothetical protein
MKGISRIDQPEKRNHGWFVRLQRDGKRWSAFFSDRKNSGKAKALKNAQKFYAKLTKDNPPLKRSERAARKLASRSLQGVSKITTTIHGHTYSFWQASWSPKSGTRKTVKFSINKYGSAKAKDMAVKARKSGLKSIKD